MALGSTLPPQAYTREILTAAFNWLQTQSDSTRKLATNPDALVGLYMRAQRLGEVADADAPISSQNFMSDLKNLAEGLKQFEAPLQAHQQSPPQFPPQFPPQSQNRGRAHAPPPSANGYRSSGTQYQASVHAPTHAPNHAATHAPPIQQTAHHTAHHSAQHSAHQAASPLTQPAGVNHQPMGYEIPSGPALNDRALSMIQDVKSQLNLSSDAEVLNMMIALAYKSLKNLLA